MKLFYVPGTCALAPHIALQESGLKYEAIRIDPQTKKTASGADYMSINPKGYVPAIQTKDDQVLTESAVLLQFIADQKPEKNLIPKFGTFERYKAMEWLNFIATELHKGFGPLWANPPDEIRKPVMDKIGKRLDVVEKHLLKTNFLLGKEVTVCDMYLFTVLTWTPRLKVDLSKWPRLMGFTEIMKSRSAVVAVMKAEGLI
jgi:glutathione S-transferase